MLKNIDNFLNSVTMYRLMIYSLLLLALYSAVLTFFDILSFNLGGLVFSFFLLILTSLLTDKILAWTFKKPVNTESSVITAMILFFVMTPVVLSTNFSAAGILVLAAFIAIASKYFLVINGSHVFNPAAAGIFLSGVLLSGGSSWWVSSPAMFPLVALLGLLIIRKLQRFHLFFSFLLASLVSAIIFGSITGLLKNSSLISFLSQWFLSWPVFFFGAFMLTEPQTTPPRKFRRMIYGGLVGILFGAPIHAENFYLTSELALMLGNIFSFSAGFKKGLVLRFRGKRELGRNIFEFIFTPNKSVNFAPGQYLEWTLTHKNPDSRGIRRYFTIASSPTEGGIRLATKFVDTVRNLAEESSVSASPEISNKMKKGSSFKAVLLALEAGDRVLAHSPDGDFVLPADFREKLVFIAGGIGITPFRSMIKFLLDLKKKMNITLFYACSDPAEFVYKDLLKEAEGLGLKTVYVLTKTPTPSDWIGRTGLIDKRMINEEASDFRERIFYLSGPEAMVENYEKLLLSLGIPQSKIKTDYFPGY